MLGTHLFGAAGWFELFPKFSTLVQIRWKSPPILRLLFMLVQKNLFDPSKIFFIFFVTDTHLPDFFHFLYPAGCRADFSRALVFIFPALKKTALTKCLRGCDKVTFFNILCAFIFRSLNYSAYWRQATPAQSCRLQAYQDFGTRSQ